MAQNASVVFATARTLLNDDGMSLWTDTVLAPKLAHAHRELQAKLRLYACPITRTNLIKDVAANTTNITDTTLIEPISLWERDTLETDDKYVKMTQSDPLPVTVPIARLVYWKWNGASIDFLGCTANRKVKIFCKAMLPIPAVGGDNLGVIDGELYLAPRVAAFAFGSTGNSTAAGWCADMATQSLNEVLMANQGRSPGTQRP